MYGGPGKQPAYFQAKANATLQIFPLSEAVLTITSSSGKHYGPTNQKQKCTFSWLQTCIPQEQKHTAHFSKSLSSSSWISRAQGLTLAIKLTPSVSSTLPLLRRASFLTSALSTLLSPTLAHCKLSEEVHSVIPAHRRMRWENWVPG